MSKTSEQVRREFLQFFEDRGHAFVPSGSLLPADDPTLLFTNAGMNQFKDVFLGTGTRPYKRAVNSQKCIRAGGKHNDLEDVGHDTCHQTFFEMLGNWSFGDYFKAEAIQWAWELLTGVWGLPKDKLWATVLGGDEPAGLSGDTESIELWPKVTDLPAERVLRFDISENFWEMADTGPCGVNTEIHIDLGEGACDGSRHAAKACGINVEDCGRFIELWNLVFIQFNRDESGRLEPLPAKHVDTGLGFERICAVLRGATSNYDTDVFRPLMAWLEKRCGVRYGGAHDTDVAFRVVADHARACTFAIADGVLPSNEGRGYVIRRILRRAARFGRKLGEHEPFLHLLTPVIVEQMGEVFPEIARRQKQVTQTIREEEVSFNRTLDRGLEVFERVAAKADKQIGGELAFELYTTYGFPVDLTQLMAAERGLTVDMQGYEKEMARHREISAAGAGFQAATVTGLPETDDSAKYETGPVQAKVLGWVMGEDYVKEGSLPEGSEAAVVLDKTRFYGESGGQVGDTGSLAFHGGRFDVRDTKLVGHCVLHVGIVAEGTLKAGDEVTVQVGPQRADTMRNHTATHLLNWSLRKVLGSHVEQAGSVVGPKRLRFDFTHAAAVTDEELAEVERLVNERLLVDESVVVLQLPLLEARRIQGVRAVFGERYPDPVRVISIGTDDPVGEATKDTPVELCGGAHVQRTSQIGFFKIVSEESVAKGVRRITAVTGHEAVRYVQRLDESARSVAAALRVPVEEMAERVVALQKEVKQLRKRPGAGAAAFQSEFVVETPRGRALIGRTDVSSLPEMRKLCDVERQKGVAAMLVAAIGEGGVTVTAMVAEALVKAGEARADEWVRVAAAVVGGSGGGKPTMAQAGGKDADKLPEALRAARDWIRDRLGGTG
ncbi:MAG: hypothetical protein AMJ81_10040 [Phycisphaerae bacterium SM23_33]|nr:MAG: hypothetical protein AMJ81_10040 [Phycisphaerae bacterium SM23_33]